MKILIIEDEKRTAEQIKRLINRYDNSYEVIGVLESVKSAVEWFGSIKESPDLLLADIQLSDGTSFELFDQANIELPVVFITAYNDYALNAFKMNSIEYLLKPIDFNDLRRAFDKFRRLKEVWFKAGINEREMLRNNIKPAYKSRFLVRSGNSLKCIYTTEINYFVIEDGAVFASLKNGTRNIIDNSLAELNSLLDPSMFFQLNRKVITSVSGIVKISNYLNRRVIVKLIPGDLEVVVSRERVAGFKLWLDR